MSKPKFTDTISMLQGMAPWDVPLNPEVQNHITAVFNSIHGEGGEAFCEREARYIHRTIVEDKKKWTVTPLSVFLAFVDLAVKNLTLEPGAQALCYLLHRSVKLPAAGDKEVWENRVYIAITGYGEILLRQRAGQIRHCDTPTVVYEGDDFSYRESGGRKQVSYALDINHNPARPRACFMKITRIDGSIDYAIILSEAWARLSKYSEKQNKGMTNPLYSSGEGNSIDPGFLIAKCVKHAFKSYPPLPIGRGMVMEADLPDKEQAPDYYNLGDTSSPDIATDPAPHEATSFDPPRDTSAGIVIDTDNDEAHGDDAW